VEAYFKQQKRWGNGGLSLLLSGEIFHSKLNIWQKLCYLSGSFYYISHTFSVILSFAGIFLLWNHYRLIGFDKEFLLFFPYIEFSFVMLPLLRNSKFKIGVYLAYIVFAYSYIYAFFASAKNSSLSWTPSNTKSKGASLEFKKTVWFVTAYEAVFAILFLNLVLRNPFFVTNIKYLPVTGWIYLLLALNIAFLYLGYKKIFSGYTEKIKSFVKNPSDVKRAEGAFTSAENSRKFSSGA
jgi:hypothetical protein